MRALRKILCLVLALVMVLGLCAVGASAVEFADADEINYKEAVALLSAIGVINGIEVDGKTEFQPRGTLTRAQAAKIIAYLLQADESELGSKSAFIDCSGHWADGCIAYVAAKKIVGGYGDGNFGPEDKLTGYAFAKMLLCAVGYDAVNEKMVGDTWEVGVATLSKKTALLTGVASFDGTAECPRELACQMAFNALGVQKVAYKNSGSTIVAGDLTITTVSTSSEKLWLDSENEIPDNLFNDFDLGETIDIDENDLIGIAYTQHGEQITGAYGDWVLLYSAKTGDTGEDIMKGAGIKTTDTNPALIMKNGCMMLQYTDAAGNLAESLGEAFVRFEPCSLMSAGDEWTVPAGIKCDIFYSRTNEMYIARFTYTYLCKASAGIKVTSGEHKGEYEFRFVIEDNYFDEYVHSFSVYGPAKDSYEGFYWVRPVCDFEVFRTLLMGDNNGNGGAVVESEPVMMSMPDVSSLLKIKTIEKADPVLTKATKVTPDSVFIDGTEYVFNSEIAYWDYDDESIIWPGFTSDLLFNEVEYYLKNDCLYLARVPDGAEIVKNVVYVVASYSRSAQSSVDDYGVDNTPADKYYVQCVDMEGNEVTYQVAEAYQGAKKCLMYVSTAYNDELKAECAQFSAIEEEEGYVSENATVAANAKKIGSTYFKSGVKFIYIDGSLGALKVTVKEGPQILSDDTVEYIAKQEGSNLTTSVVIVEREWVAQRVSGNGIIFATETSDSTDASLALDANGDTKVVYEKAVYIDGIKTSIFVREADALDGFYTYTKDGEITDVAEVESEDGLDIIIFNKAPITGIYNGEITVSGVVEDKATSSAVFADTAVKVDNIEEASQLQVGDYVAIVLDENGEIAVIYRTDVFDIIK